MMTDHTEELRQRFDALEAENEKWRRNYRDIHEPALRDAHAYIQELHTELEAARRLLRNASSAMAREGMESALVYETDTFLTTTGLKIKE